MVSVPVNLVGVSCCHPSEGRFCCSLLGPNIDTGRRIETTVGIEGCQEETKSYVEDEEQFGGAGRNRTDA
jgi:hypothetical protein